MKWFFLSKPTKSDIDSFMASQEKEPFSYEQVGATRAEILPRGFVVDCNSTPLGKGEEIFERAVEAIRNWGPFEIPWLRLFSQGRAPFENVVVAILIRHRFAWSLSSCRVVYTFDASDAEVRRVGFAYGTLQAHAERGEERFEVAWDRHDGVVRYNLLAFSRPRHWLAVAGYPIARRLQRRFVRDSQKAMREGVSRPSGR